MITFLLTRIFMKALVVFVVIVMEYIPKNNVHEGRVVVHLLVDRSNRCLLIMLDSLYLQWEDVQI